MNIKARCAAEFSKDGEKFRFGNGYAGKVPDWVREHPYFEKLVNEGLVLVLAEPQKAREKTRRGG